MQHQTLLGCGLIPIAPLLRIGGYNSEIVGYGPEDDLFNQRLKNYARIYYHKGSLVSSTFHIPHKPLQQQNKKKNWMYWSHSLSHQALHGAFSDTVIRVHDLMKSFIWTECLNCPEIVPLL